MNELIPVKNDEIPLSSHEATISMQHWNPSRSPSQNKMIRYLFLLFFLFIFRHRNSAVSYQNTEGQPIQAKPFSPGFNLTDPAVIDKISFLLDSMKKVSAIRELKKNMLESGAKDGKSNLDLMTEMLETFKKSNSENNSTQISSVSNIVSMMDKFKDMKKLMNIQNAFKNEADSKDASAQINHLIEIIRPMLPAEQAANIDNLKKMAQMMKLMSFLDLPKEEKKDINQDDQNNDEQTTQNA